MAKKSKSEVELPTCTQLVLCDALVFDPNSSKPNLFGVFDNLTPAKIPSPVKFSVFLKLYGGKGIVPINIAFVDSKGEPIDGASMDIEDFVGKPGQNAKIGGTIAGEIKTKGNHKVVVRSGSKILAETSPIQVTIRPKK